MRVTTSQHEISGKNHISVKTKPSRADKKRWKKQHFGMREKIGGACRPRFLHAKLITFQCIQVTDDYLTDR